MQFLWISNLGYELIFLVLAAASLFSFCLALTVQEKLEIPEIREKLI